MADELTTADILKRMAAAEDGTDAKMRRQIQAQAMAGRPLSPEQEAFLSGKLPAKEATSERIGVPMGYAAELTGVPQGIRAASAIGKAVEDPSLPNVTSAAGNTALAVGKPMHAVKIVGTGLAAALGKDLGFFGSDTANAQNAVLPGLEPEQQKEYDTLKAKIAKGRYRTYADMEGDARRKTQLEDISNEFVKQRNAGKTGAADKAAALALEERDRSVRTAETARDRELARDRRFSDTNAGKMWDATGGMMPMAFGGMAGVLARGAAGNGTSALGKALNNYLVPIGAGGVAGVTSYNVPLAYNAFFTEPDNPKRLAYEAYARELPPDHPRKQEWTDYAAKLPAKNPLREEAQKEFFDSDQMKKRAMWGAVEGAGGGMLGSDVVRWPARAITSLWNARSGNPAAAAQTAQPGAALSTVDRMLETRAPASPPAAPTASPQATSATVSPAAQAPMPQRPSPPPASPPNQEPSLHRLLTQQDLERLIQKAEQEMKGHWDFQPRKNGQFSGPPKYPKDQKPD